MNRSTEIFIDPPLTRVFAVGGGITMNRYEEPYISRTNDDKPGPAVLKTPTEAG